MKIFYKVILTAWVGASLSIATANANQVLFDGDAYIFAASGTCGYKPVGAHYIVRFAPANVGSNNSDSQMAWFQTNTAFGFDLNGGSFSPTAQTVTAGSIYSGAVGYTTPVTIAFSKQAPATITASTTFVEVVGFMTNFPGAVGCTVQFRLALGQSQN